MSEETFVITLGGRCWSLPHLPFRAVKAIQPALFQVYADAGGAETSGAGVARLGEAQFDRLAEAAWRAIVVVEPTLDHQAFLNLPFSVRDLIEALPALAKAAGLRAEPTQATQEASPPAGKSTSTA